MHLILPFCFSFNVIEPTARRKRPPSFNPKLTDPRLAALLRRGRGQREPPDLAC
jgi:hypothetical protein